MKRENCGKEGNDVFVCHICKHARCSTACHFALMDKDVMGDKLNEWTDQGFAEAERRLARAKSSV